MLGTVLPLEKGPDEDEFFLTFDRIGTNIFNRPPPRDAAGARAADLRGPASTIGVRTFDEISASMAKLTGVSQNDAGVRATFDDGPASRCRPSRTVEAVLVVASGRDRAARDRVLQRAHGERRRCARRCSPASTSMPRRRRRSATRTRCSIRCSIACSAPPSSRISRDKNAVAHGARARLIQRHPGRSGAPGPAELAGVTNDAARTRTIAKAVCSAVVGSAAMLVQ